MTLPAFYASVKAFAKFHGGKDDVPPPSADDWYALVHDSASHTVH